MNINIENKNCAVSEKTIDIMKENEENYEELKESLIEKANNKLGFDFQTEYYLPENFSLNSFSDEHFKKYCSQKIAMPFSDSAFEKFISMKKTIINKEYLFNNRGKNIYGVYLIAVENNKPILFSLSIVKKIEDNQDNLDFSIKVDMCVGGKEWLSLLRLDSMGPAHPNYIKNGKVSKREEVVFSFTPHIHKNNEACQVISYNNLLYTTAIECQEFLKQKKLSCDPTYFKSAIQLVYNMCGIEANFNSKIEKNFKYDKKNSLLKKDSTTKIENTNELKGRENEF